MLRPPPLLLRIGDDEIIAWVTTVLLFKLQLELQLDDELLLLLIVDAIAVAEHDVTVESSSER